MVAVTMTRREEGMLMWLDLALRLLVRILIGLAAPAVIAMLLLPAAQARAQSAPLIVNISATTSGCGSNGHACDNAADHLPPGSTFHLISPKTITLDEGTYRLSYAGTMGRYRGWRINAEQWWVWNFGIAVNKGSGMGQLLYVAIARGIYKSLDAVTASREPIVAGPGGPNSRLPVLIRSGGPTRYVDTLKLPKREKLSFFILDYDVRDNAGGVSLKIERLADKH